MKSVNSRWRASLLNVGRAAAVAFCAYVLFRRIYVVGAASRIIAPIIDELNEVGVDRGTMDQLDVARQYLNQSMDPLFLATLMLVVLALVPWAKMSSRVDKHSEDGET